MLTDSFTCWREGFAAGASFLPPPMESMVSPTVPKMVPRARYSFLMARPRITLRACRKLTWLRKTERAQDALGHGGSGMVVSAGAAVHPKVVNSSGKSRHASMSAYIHATLTCIRSRMLRESGEMSLSFLPQQPL